MVMEFAEEWGKEVPFLSSFALGLEGQTADQESDVRRGVLVPGMAGKRPSDIIEDVSWEVSNGQDPDLEDCSFRSDSKFKIFSQKLSDTVKPADMAFELILPIAPELACNESDGLGLAVDISTDGAITEYCRVLSAGPAVESYLLWVFLRPWKDHRYDVFEKFRHSTRSTYNLIVLEYGYAKHTPLSHQPPACKMKGKPDGDKVHDDYVYVFGQELWSRTDPRLSDVAVGGGREDLKNKLEELRDRMGIVDMKECVSEKMNDCTILPIEVWQERCDEKHGPGYERSRWEYCDTIFQGRYICRKEWFCWPTEKGQDCCNEE